MGKTQIPENFAITDSMKEWARLKVPNVDIEAQTEQFVDYWKGNGKKMVDWVATWRNWMRRSRQFSRAKPSEEHRWRP